MGESPEKNDWKYFLYNQSWDSSPVNPALGGKIDLIQDFWTGDSNLSCRNLSRGQGILLPH